MIKRLCLLAALLAGATVAAASREFPSYDVVPTASEPPWIRYWFLALQNHPFPVVYVSHEAFKSRAIAEFFVILPRSDYGTISALTHERLTWRDCLPEPPNETPAVQILQHGNEGNRQCILPPEAACRYLSHVVMLPGLRWEGDGLNPIHNFMGEVGCQVPAETK